MDRDTARRISHSRNDIAQANLIIAKETHFQNADVFRLSNADTHHEVATVVFNGSERTLVYKGHKISADTLVWDSNKTANPSPRVSRVLDLLQLAFNGPTVDWDLAQLEREGRA